MKAGMCHVGIGDLEEMSPPVPTGKLTKRFEWKAAYTPLQKAAQESTNYVLPANIVESEKGTPHPATQANRATRALGAIASKRA